ncbi:transposase [Luteolibacter ambystomatis]|uniref:Transposase n=1 Tax=Luteolibacter ambystomatis TaxID=2824561 RepID=A0A975PH35_9BACT|nr:transposase [Luteolibacter ambystomatis]QUE53200.1 transposase [Luteolibacter ambystomatis]
MTPEREQQLLERISALEQENALPRQKLDLVLRKLFGKSSEALDPAQLELLLGEPPGKAPASPTFGDAPVVEASAASVARPDRKPRRERIPDHLPVVEEVLLPEPVEASPDVWRRIGEERSDQLDYQPAGSSSAA